MVDLAREYAFNKDYKQAEGAAQFINDHMDFPRDYYDHVYGAIVEAATLYGDDNIATDAYFKMTNFRAEHYQRAAELLVYKGDYVRALNAGRHAYKYGQIRIAKSVLEKDPNQIGLVRENLKYITSWGVGASELESLVDLIAAYPALDPDGKFIIQIFSDAFEHNGSLIPHKTHRVILENLRKIILARVQGINPSLRITDMFKQVNKALPPAAEAPSQPAEDSAMNAHLGKQGQNKKVDGAMKGGIDLTPANMNLQTQNAGRAIKFYLDPAMLARLQNAPGFRPVIISVQPLKSLQEFLGSG